MHRTARIATIALLALGVIALAILLAWSLNLRDHFDDYKPTVKGGLVAVVLLAGTKWLATLTVLIVVGIGLAIAAIRRRRWAYPVTTVLGALTLAGVWFARLVVVHLEDPRFRARSPWVHAATLVAIVATIYLVLVIVAAALAWKSRPAPPA